MSKTLVAYFSATGATKRLAEAIADAAQADLFEIVPETPYTDADLNWQNSKSRSSIEMGDKAFRPAVASHVEDIDRYDTILVGFPIWWYVAPTIVNTFLEAYDLSGKTVVPFATSGMSLMGNTNAELEPSCPGAKLIEGKRFGYANEKEITSWLGSLGL